MLAAELGTRKPDPKVFEECARLLDLPPEQLVLVGNNVYRDVQSARNASYCHAFHIQRAGALRSFNPGLARKIGDGISKWTSITSLNELVWYLRGCENTAPTTEKVGAIASLTALYTCYGFRIC